MDKSDKYEVWVTLVVTRKNIVYKIMGNRRGSRFWTPTITLI